MNVIAFKAIDTYMYIAISSVEYCSSRLSFKQNEKKFRFEIHKKCSLVNMEYVDDVCLLSQSVTDLGQIALYLEREAGRIGLKMNTYKT